MKKILFYISLLFFMQIFMACTSKMYNNTSIDNQATLHPISNGKTMLGIDIVNITIMQINGEETGDFWNGKGGDEQINSGKTNIFVRYLNKGIIASTTFIFIADAGKVYDISGKEVDDSVIFTISVNGQIIDTKTEKKQLASQMNYSYVPIII